MTKILSRYVDTIYPALNLQLVVPDTFDRSLCLYSCLIDIVQGSVCHPYLSLSYYDILEDVNIRSFVIGASNVLFKQKRNNIDVLVEVSSSKPNFTSYHLLWHGTCILARRGTCISKSMLHQLSMITTYIIAYTLTKLYVLMLSTYLYIVHWCYMWPLKKHCEVNTW